MINPRLLFCFASGTFGSFFIYVLGGFDMHITSLFTLMVVDYFTGLILCFMQKSPKSANGGLQSDAGFKGIFKKIVTLFLVVVATRIDNLLSTNYIRNGVIIAYCTNETISIIENAGLLGVKIPKILKNSIDILKEKI